jgi:hypothetical protein
MDQYRLTEYFGLCVAFAVRAIRRVSGSASGFFSFPHNIPGIGKCQEMERAAYIQEHH